MDYWMLPGEAAEPLRVAASPSAPHAISACIYLIFNPPLQLLSLIQVVSALFCFSILKGYLDGYVLSKRRCALPWSKRGNRNIREYRKSVNHFAFPTGRPNQQKCWICWEMVENWTVKIRGVFVLHLLWAGWAGGIGLFAPLPLLQISAYTGLPHSRYQQLGFLSLKQKKILHFLPGLMWVHAAIWKCLHGLHWSRSLFTLFDSVMGVRCSVHQFL